MYTLWLVTITVSVALCIFFYNKLNAAKSEVAKIKEALSDIKQGNGNRRVLSKPDNIISPITFELNEVINYYEGKINNFQRLEQLNKQLLTSLSHDIRTPLTTLIGYLDAVYKGRVPGKKREEYFETSRKKAYELRNYIDTLFDWFKLNSGEYQLNEEKVEITELTRNYIINWIQIFEDSGVQYKIEIPEKAIYTLMDKEAYHRILDNIIQNVIIHSGAALISITMDISEKEIEINIRDNGVGIPKDKLPHIFERLYKCDSSRGKKGSGLGLSIVKQLVEIMKGYIKVYSVENEFTCFQITLPIVREV